VEYLDGRKEPASTDLSADQDICEMICEDKEVFNKDKA
jgi:hypothetical protein